jgi:tetratricopeptide (TPR) repeat protein
MPCVAVALLILAVTGLGGPPRFGVASGSAAGQAPAQPVPDRAPASNPSLAHLTSWLEAISEHRPGLLDAPARLIGFWTEGELDGVRRDFFALLAACRRERSRSGRPEPMVFRDRAMSLPEWRQLLGLTDDEMAQGNANRILHRAAILHADIAMIVIPVLPGGTGCSSRPTLLVADGNTVRSSCLGIHWTFARALLDAVKPGPGKDPIGRLWYQATITYMMSIGDLADGDFHIPHGQRLFPDDPVILFEHGLYHEVFASPVIHTAAVESLSDKRSAKAHLEEAADHFGKALKGNPHFVEARVHRGFVLGELGRYDDAAGELRQAVDQAQGPQLSYYAELFLGRAEESLGNLSEARRHYTRASEIYPRAQSPRLSLTLLARQRGDRAEVMNTMGQVLSLPHADREQADPWWDYFRWQNRSAAALLADLYRPFLRGREQ